MSLPFALARSLWPPLMNYGFAANILSALFAGVGVYHLNRIFYRFGFGRTARILWSLLYIANPLILLYSANGMTDGMECALIIASLDGLIEYLQDDRLLAVARGGAWLAAAFMVRYESVPMGAMIGIGLLVALWRRWGDVQKAIGVCVAYLYPVVSAGVIWMLLNWMIMGNPVWFATSKYSNSAQISSGTYNYPQVVAANHHIGETLYQVAHFSDNFWPFFLVLAAVLVLQFRHKPDPVGLPIALGSLGVPLFQAALLYKHSSADWDRFFIYYIPFGVILSAYLVSKIKVNARRNFIALASCIVLISAGYGAWSALHNAVWGNGETSVLSALGFPIDRYFTIDGRKERVHGHPINDYSAIISLRQVADYINDHPKLIVITSTFSSYGAMPLIKRPNQVVFDNEPDFRSILLNPRGRVNAIIAVPNSAINSTSDEIVRVYPTLWAGDLPWTKLLHQFSNGYRIYAVLKDAP